MRVADEALFEYYFTSQIGTVDLATGRRTAIGRPGLYERVSASPSGEHLLTVEVERPYSWLVRAGSFPKDVTVRNRGGEIVASIARLPLADAVPIGGVPTGPRRFTWDPTRPATLVWVEAEDGGDPRATVPHRDRVLAHAAPFDGEPAEIARTEYRFSGISWTADGTALLTENDRPTRWTRTTLLDADGGRRTLWDRSTEDRYADAGRPLAVRRPGGAVIRQTDGGAIYLTGNGASPDGDRPFLDRLDLATLDTERLFQSAGDAYEVALAPLSDDGNLVLTRRETRTEPPNYLVRDIAADTVQPLTAFEDPAPQLAGISKELITYERADGVQLSGTLYLPPGYQDGDRVPMLVWAYPREYVDPRLAGQVTGSDNRFTTMAEHLLLLTQGYAIFDGPTMPIIGPGETANDTYVEQLVASAQAAVDTVVARGVTDRDNIGIGGHSYGAFMTANLLAHSDIFQMGIARSGAYNRSLTPFGFQNERRTFWEATDIYAAMSPFFHADKLDEPILLIHGEIDNNSGTFPIQSEPACTMALKGHGGDRALRDPAERVPRLHRPASRCCTSWRRCCAGATSTWERGRPSSGFPRHTNRKGAGWGGAAAAPGRATMEGRVDRRGLHQQENAMSEHTHEVTDGNFEESVLKSTQPVLVDFWAEWCGPCRMIAPTVEALAADYDGRVTVGKMNVDDNPATPGQYGVRSIPTLLLFKDGQVVESVVGLADKARLQSVIDPHVG